MKKILAFGAHPDDVEFGAGGLLIKEIEHGSQVKIVVCSLGEAGTNGTPEGRKAEAEAAAKYMGAEIEFIDLGGDGHMVATPEYALRFAVVIRDYQPDVVLAPLLIENQHPDHHVVAQLARSACRLSRYGGLAELSGKSHTVKHLYHFPSSPGVSSRPDIVIDVSDQYERWVEAMSLHASQMKTKNYIEMVGSRARMMGASIGVRYAAILWTSDPMLVETL